MKDLNQNLKQYLRLAPEEVQKKMDKALGRNQNFRRSRIKKRPL